MVRDQVQPGDLRALKRLQSDLAAVVDASDAGDEPTTVSRLNALLEQHPVRPRISGHDAQTWHLHVNDTQDPVAAILTGGGLFGMSLASPSSAPTGSAGAPPRTCHDAFFDATANHSKRFCSARDAPAAPTLLAYRSRADRARRGLIDRAGDDEPCR